MSSNGLNRFGTQKRAESNTLYNNISFDCLPIDVLEDFENEECHLEHKWTPIEEFAEEDALFSLVYDKYLLEENADETSLYSDQPNDSREYDYSWIQKQYSEYLEPPPLKICPQYGISRQNSIGDDWRRKQKDSYYLYYLKSDYTNKRKLVRSKLRKGKRARITIRRYPRL